MTDKKTTSTAPRRNFPSWALLIATAAVVAILAFLIRAPEPEPPPAGPGGWLTGTDAERFDRLAEHHRGLGVAMWEIGHRYRELAWAGEVQDWEYARHQLEEIEEALWMGVDRRPIYAESARIFVQEGIAPLRDTLASNPEEGFNEAFRQFTAACALCHAREDAPLMDLERWATALRRAPAALVEE